MLPTEGLLGGAVYWVVSPFWAHNMARLSNNLHPVLSYRRRLFGFVFKCFIDVGRYFLHALPAKADSEHATGDYQTVNCVQGAHQ